MIYKQLVLSLFLCLGTACSDYIQSVNVSNIPAGCVIREMTGKSLEVRPCKFMKLRLARRGNYIQWNVISN